MNTSSNHKRRAAGNWIAASSIAGILLVAMIAFALACGKAEAPKVIEPAQAATQTPSTAPKPITTTAAPTGTLKVADETGLSTTAPSSYSWDFGDVDPVEKPKVEHVLMVTNGGDKPLTIEKVDTSCSCTAAMIGEGKRLPMTLAPGEKAPLKVGLNILSLHTGVVKKLVRVYALGVVQPELSVEVRAKVLDAMSVEPRVVEIGKIVAGASPTVHVTAKVDSRWMDPGQSLQVTNMCQSVVVVPSTKETVKNPTDGKSMVVSQFDVKLSPTATLGLVSGSVIFQLKIAQKATGTSGTPLTKSISAPVTGEIIGAMRALPSIVLMGAMELGKGASQNILVVAADADTLSKVKVQSTHPFVTASIKEGAPAGSSEVRQSQYPAGSDGKRRLGGSGTLAVTVGPEAPTGYFRATLTCTLSGGQKLLVPVEGYVKPKA